MGLRGRAARGAGILERSILCADLAQGALSRAAAHGSPGVRNTTRLLCRLVERTARTATGTVGVRCALADAMCARVTGARPPADPAVTRVRRQVNARVAALRCFSRAEDAGAILANSAGGTGNAASATVCPVTCHGDAVISTCGLTAGAEDADLAPAHCAGRTAPLAPLLLSPLFLAFLLVLLAGEPVRETGQTEPPAQQRAERGSARARCSHAAGQVIKTLVFHRRDLHEAFPSGTLLPA